MAAKVEINRPEGDKIDFIVFEKSKNDNKGIDYWRIKYYLYLLFYKWVSTECEKKVKPTWGGGCAFSVSPDYSFPKITELIKSGQYKEVEVIKRGMRDIKGLNRDFQRLLVNIEEGFENRLTDNQIVEDVELINNTYISDVREFMDICERIMDRYKCWISKEEQYTPTYISKLISGLILADNKNIKSICDPSSGSGSLLVKCLSEISKVKKLGMKVAAYGINPEDTDIFKMNLLVQGFINQIKWSLTDEDIEDPDKYQFIVSHPRCPKRNTFAFMLKHLLWLDTTINARLMLILPKEFITIRDNLRIRKYLVDNNLLDCVIDLPKGCFNKKDEAKCIVVLRRRRKHRKVLMINAVEKFTALDKTCIMEQSHIDWIVEIYRKKTDSKRDAMIVQGEVIVACDYNISPSFYLPKRPKLKRTKIIINPTDQVSPMGSEVMAEVLSPIVEIFKFIGKYMFVIEYEEKDVQKRLEKMRKKHKSLLLKKQAKLNRMKIFNKNLV